MTQLDELFRLLQCYQWPLTTEAELQAALWKKLEPLGFEREYRFDAKNRIDFYHYELMTGIEVKIKGRAPEILKQCERYCELYQMKRLILVTNRAMGFPPHLNGKPCHVIQLGRSWL